MAAQLHDDLHLSGAQESAWRQYTLAMSRGAEAQSRRQATQQLMPTLPTPRRLALLDATMSEDLADFHRQSQAVTAFYDQLSPDQQRIFDRETLPPSDPSSSGNYPAEPNMSRQPLRAPPQ